MIFFLIDSGLIPFWLLSEREFFKPQKQLVRKVIFAIRTFSYFALRPF